MVTRDEYHCEDNLSKKLNKARQQRQNFFSQCLKRQAAAVDEAECEEERDGYAEVAGAVSEDGRVGGAGDQVYQVGANGVTQIIKAMVTLKQNK